MLLDRDASLLCIIDIQERLAPAIFESQTVIDNAQKMISAARRLSVPIVCSEQYPKGLGATVSEVRVAIPIEAVFEKLHFSCADDSDIVAHVGQLSRRQLVLCGMEAHVCVLQSALGFKQLGYDVFVVADSVSSRVPDSKQVALARLSECGVQTVTTEMVLFEWLKQAGTPEFKDLRGLIA